MQVEAMDPSPFFSYPTADAQPPPDLEFFAEGTEEEWGKLLAYTEMQLFDAGDTVSREGETDRALYLLTEGTLEFVGPGHPSRLTPVTVFGERSFLDGLPRSVTVRAISGGEILRLGREAFDALCVREPRLGHTLLLELGRIVSVRFRNAEMLHRAAR